VIEKVAQFGPERTLVGIETPSADKDAGLGRPIWIFLNAGIVYRVGPHRLTVNLARRLAQNGFSTLRFDLSGLGDSAARAAVSFQKAAVMDIREAMDYLEASTGTKRFVLCGLCSGADNSLNAASVDRRVVGLALLDPYAYTTPGHYLRRFLRQVRSVSSWKTLARVVLGHAHLSPELPSGVGLCAVGQGVQRPPRSYKRPTPGREEFAADLRSLLDRGCKILAVYSKLEEYTYAEQFDEAFAPFGIAGRISTEFMAEANHTYTELAQQQKLVEVLLDWASKSFPRQSQATDIKPDAASSPTSRPERSPP
jgi:pimeloyl-ACP methyl ester carboxylesterase